MLGRPEGQLAAGRVADEDGAPVVLEGQPGEMLQRPLEVLACGRPGAAGNADAAVLEVPARYVRVGQGAAEVSGVDQVVRRLPVAAV